MDERKTKSKPTKIPARCTQHLEHSCYSMNLKYTKEYTVKTSYEDLYSSLDTIVSTNFNNSKYSTFGEAISLDPPVFLFMAKWVSLGKPFFTKMVSAGVYASLFTSGSNSKIILRGKSNPGLIFMSFALICVSFLKLISYNKHLDLIIPAFYFILAIGVLLLNRVIIKLVIASLKTDLKQEKISF